MKIHQDLVYDKTRTFIMHGFVNLGNVNEQLMKLERNLSGDNPPVIELASHMLTLMVRGLFIKLEFINHMLLALSLKTTTSKQESDTHTNFRSVYFKVACTV